MNATNSQTMIKRKTTTAPDQILDHLRSIVAEAENMLSRSGFHLGEHEIDRLKRRFDDGIENLREQYSEMEERVRTYWEEVEYRLQTSYEDIERRLRRRVRTTDRAIRRHPYRSMGIAFGTGIVIAAILAVCNKR